MSDQPKRVVIIGAGGMLGRALVQEAGWRGLSVRRYPTRRELDITESAAVDDALGRHRVDYVINAAAWTDVDAAETDAMSAYEVNWSGPANCAWCCAHTKSTFVHFSTDYVFDGSQPLPYVEDAAAQPLNAYGASKLAGEEAIRASGVDHLILRSSWLFAPYGRNFVRTILDRARLAEEIPVVNDQRGRPTSCADLAAMTFDLLEVGARGTVHAANDGTATWCDLAKAVVTEASLSCRIRPCRTIDEPRPARRPANGVLDLAKLRGLIGQPRHWTEALATCVRDAIAIDAPGAAKPPNPERWRLNAGDAGHEEPSRAAA